MKAKNCKIYANCPVFFVRCLEIMHKQFAGITGWLINMLQTCLGQFILFANVSLIMYRNMLEGHIKVNTKQVNLQYCKFTCLINPQSSILIQFSEIGSCFSAPSPCLVDHCSNRVDLISRDGRQIPYTRQEDGFLLETNEIQDSTGESVYVEIQEILSTPTDRV